LGGWVWGVGGVLDPSAPASRDGGCWTVAEPVVPLKAGMLRIDQGGTGSYRGCRDTINVAVVSPLHIGRADGDDDEKHD